MANLFLCNGERVKFGNGATEMLYKHWLRLLEDEPDRLGKRILQPVLERYVDLAAGSGIAGFGMDRERMPEALLDMRAAWTLMKLVRLTVDNVRRAAGITPDAWERTVQGLDQTMVERWEEVLRHFHDALADWVAPP